MFERLSEWAKGLFASHKKQGVQTTATEAEESNEAPPKRASYLAHDDWERIERALEQGLPLTCQVLASKKGGYTVSVLGTYAFLPNTLAHYKKSHTPDKVLGKEMQVYVRSVKNAQILVSHIEFVKEAYSKLAIGDVYNAVVVQIYDGRLLVYMPDNELYAMVPQQELSWSLNATTSDYYPGQQVQVRITNMGGIEKIRASIRQASEANPYEKCINDYHEGDILTGKVFNIVEFGAFIKISEGVVGLLHRSEVRWDIATPNMKEVFKYGDIVKVMVCRVDREQGRIFLSLKRLNQELIEDTFKPGSVHTANIAIVTDRFVTLELPYGMNTQVRRLRFAKAGIQPIEGETIEIKVISYSPESNDMRVALRLE